MKKIAVLLATLSIAFTVGAATGTRISAMLQNQRIYVNGNYYTERVISYNGTTYVPLRRFSNFLEVPVDYRNNVIYVGDDQVTNAPSAPVPAVPSTQTNSPVVINDATIEYDSDGEECIVLDVTFYNNSGETTSLYGSNYAINAYQNGYKLYTSSGNPNANGPLTSVRPGSSLRFKYYFVLEGSSPVNVQVDNWVKGQMLIDRTYSIY